MAAQPGIDHIQFPHVLFDIRKRDIIPVKQFFLPAPFSEIDHTRQIRLPLAVKPPALLEIRLAFGRKSCRLYKVLIAFGRKASSFTGIRSSVFRDKGLHREARTKSRPEYTIWLAMIPFFHQLL